MDVSKYITDAIFGSGNSVWEKNPTKDPMYDFAKSKNLTWSGSIYKSGYYRVHYLHCSGIWVDRVHIEMDHYRGKVVETGDWADNFEAEWMLIPDDFPMPNNTASKST